MGKKKHFLFQVTCSNPHNDDRPSYVVLDSLDLEIMQKHGEAMQALKSSHGGLCSESYNAMTEARFTGGFTWLAVLPDKFDYLECEDGPVEIKSWKAFERVIDPGDGKGSEYIDYGIDVEEYAVLCGSSISVYVCGYADEDRVEIEALNLPELKELLGDFSSAPKLPKGTKIYDFNVSGLTVVNLGGHVALTRKEFEALKTSGDVEQLLFAKGFEYETIGNDVDVSGADAECGEETWTF